MPMRVPGRRFTISGCWRSNWIHGSTACISSPRLSNKTSLSGTKIIAVSDNVILSNILDMLSSRVGYGYTYWLTGDDSWIGQSIRSVCLNRLSAYLIKLAWKHTWCRVLWGPRLTQIREVSRDTFLPRPQTYYNHYIINLPNSTTTFSILSGFTVYRSSLRYSPLFSNLALVLAITIKQLRCKSKTT